MKCNLKKSFNFYVGHNCVHADNTVNLNYCTYYNVGVTGPLLLYDESLFGICSDVGVDYLSIRVWIGLWMIIISMFVSMFQGSLLVKYFTKFTKEIFSALVSLLYTFEALKKLYKIYATHPLGTIYK